MRSATTAKFSLCPGPTVAKSSSDHIPLGRVTGSVRFDPKLLAEPATDLKRLSLWPWLTLAGVAAVGRFDRDGLGRHRNRSTASGLSRPRNVGPLASLPKASCPRGQG